MKRSKSYAAVAEKVAGKVYPPDEACAFANANRNAK